MNRAALPGLIMVAALLLSGCAYFNTYYLARKNYDKATLGHPYVIESTDASQPQFFTQTITYSKKLLAQYPKSKWVDDAYLLWARALLGRDDPIEAVNMLNAFNTRFPRSPVKPEATFYLGVATRRAHRPADALAALDEFLASSPRHELVPYALLEKSRALFALDRRVESAGAAGQLIDQYPNTPLMRSARIARSDALFADGQFEKARDDFKELGLAATDDEQRFLFLLREADCVEGARDYDREITLLRDALAHELEPVVTKTTTASGAVVETAPSGPGTDRWGRLRLRVGTAYLLSGRVPQALGEYRAVAESYPRTPLAAESQYRIGYAYETAGDDFDKARAEYGKVKDQAAASSFTKDAVTRLANLDRLSSLGAATGRDSTERKAEAAFMRAELYLFTHDRPDRALDQYRQIEKDFEGTPWGGKALNAQAWLLRRKLNRPAEADSLLWVVIHRYKATEAQLAARDYLEAEGEAVPDSLIVRPVARADTARVAAADTLRLTPPPSVTPRLGANVGGAIRGAVGDSLAPGLPGLPGMPPRGLANPRMPAGLADDSLRFMMPPSPPSTRPDSMAHHAARDTVSSAPPDTTKRRP